MLPWRHSGGNPTHRIQRSGPWPLDVPGLVHFEVREKGSGGDWIPAGVVVTDGPHGTWHVDQFQENLNTLAGDREIEGRAIVD